MRVDVLVTGHPPNADGDDDAPRALQNMLVLSAGTAIKPDARGQAIQASTVTLLATPEQAETLTLANNEGTHPTGVAQFERSDHREDRRDARSANCMAPRGAARRPASSSASPAASPAW